MGDGGCAHSFLLLRVTYSNSEIWLMIHETTTTSTTAENQFRFPDLPSLFVCLYASQFYVAFSLSLASSHVLVIYDFNHFFFFGFIYFAQTLGCRLCIPPNNTTRYHTTWTIKSNVTEFWKYAGKQNLNKSNAFTHSDVMSSWSSIIIYFDFKISNTIPSISITK